MGVELEGVVVMAEVEQVRKLSSEGPGFTAGSAEASVHSRPPLCGDPCFGFRSPGPGAEKDIEKWCYKRLCEGWAATLRPRSRGTRAHGPQEGQELGCGSDKRLHAGGPERPGPAVQTDPPASPDRPGEDKGLKRRHRPLLQGPHGTMGHTCHVQLQGLNYTVLTTSAQGHSRPAAAVRRPSAWIPPASFTSGLRKTFMATLATLTDVGVSISGRVTSTLSLALFCNRCIFYHEHILLLNKICTKMY